jgi:hypothetical protein
MKTQFFLDLAAAYVRIMAGTYYVPDCTTLFDLKSNYTNCAGYLYRTTGNAEDFKEEYTVLTPG